MTLFQDEIATSGETGDKLGKLLVDLGKKEKAKITLLGNKRNVDQHKLKDAIGKLRKQGCKFSGNNIA